MIYKGISPILAAVLVVAFTTVVTMCMVDGITKKSVAAMLGTIIGVVFSGAFALIFGQVTSITGYNVSDIENLVYVGEMTDIKIGELLFAGILIASLGAVMDVGMSIASTLNELKEQKSTDDVKRTVSIRNECRKRYDGNNDQYTDSCIYGWIDQHISIYLCIQLRISTGDQYVFRRD